MIEEDLKERRIVMLEGLEGELTIPLGAQAVVLFAHGTGSSRYSSRNQLVANLLNSKRIATLLVDLFNEKERRMDEETKHLRHNIEMLAERFAVVTSWLIEQPETTHLKIGYFASSTGAAAALIAAARLGAAKAIVTRGGRPDLVDENILHQVKTPTLFIVGGRDKPVISMNKGAFASLKNVETKELAIIPNATHLFEEPQKMEEVAQVAADWFECYLLESGKKFYNKYSKIPRESFLSSLWNKHVFQIKFRNRAAAGEMLASVLGKYKNNQNHVLVIGIARGGVVVADIIAEKLNADFDIIVPRKLRSPHNSESAIGAIMHDNSVYLDTSFLEMQKDVTNEYINSEIFQQKKEIERRLTLYRSCSRIYEVKDRIVILVDDGISTGATMIAAARWTRKQLPNHVVIAAPIASKQAVESLKMEADEIKVIINPSAFKATEQFYQDFDAVSDNQVIEIAKSHFLL